MVSRSQHSSARTSPMKKTTSLKPVLSPGRGAGRDLELSNVEYRRRANMVLPPTPARAALEEQGGTLQQRSATPTRRSPPVHLAREAAGQRPQLQTASQPERPQRDPNMLSPLSESSARLQYSRTPTSHPERLHAASDDTAHPRASSALSTSSSVFPDVAQFDFPMPPKLLPLSQQQQQQARSMSSQAQAASFSPEVSRREGGSKPLLSRPIGGRV